MDNVFVFGNIMFANPNICDIIHLYSSCEVYGVSVSYNKLWKLLIDRNMKRTELRIAAGISSSTLAKLGKNESVTTDVLVRICKTLNCDIGEIMEVVPDENSRI